jgi:N,N'-diacetyllegionaminate synthase
VKTLIIAEAGVNHNGDLGLARQLIDIAARAGADLVKFQTFSADRLVTKSAGKADYQRARTDAGESQHAMLRRWELTREMHETLIEHCRTRGIEFFSTPFDAESADLLVELGLDMFKVASGDLTNLPYLRHLAHYGKRVMLSTGMATLGDIEAAIEVLQRPDRSRDHISVLHCTTEYPAPMEEVNLRAMLTIRDAFGVEVGYSDHTTGIEVPIAAAALGATIIEKHFTLDRTLPGPDHAASLEPDELELMIRAIRNVERALGDGIKRPTASEAKNIPIARKSLVAARAIRKGECFTEANVTAKRPGNGLSPMRLDEVVGQRAPRDFVPDEPISLQ